LLIAGVLLAAGTGAAASSGLPDRDGKSLPLVEMPAATSGHSRLLALIISGDGGWAHLDRDVAQQLVAHGIAVVGLDSPKYFSTGRDPDGVARDVARITSQYLTTWNRLGLVLIGFSTGADVLPFVVNRLPAALRGEVRLVVLIGPYGTANFRYRLVDWLDAPPPAGARQTLPEILLSGQYQLRTLCIYGAAEEKSLCPRLAATNVHVVTLPGGHHFHRDFDRVGRVILQALAQ
jgi:type IV secretory pathway VirJ component